MATIITVAIRKGGNMKTTSANNIAWSLAIHHSKRVLLVDLDSQCNLTQSNGLVRPDLDNTMYELFNQVQSGVDPQTKGYVFSLRSQSGKAVGLLAGSNKLKSADREYTIPMREMMLDTILEPVKHLYDCIVIDTPPSFSFLVHNALACSDYLLIPCTPDYLSTTGVSVFLADVRQFIKQMRGLPLQIGGLMIGRYNPNNSTILSRQMVESLREQFKDLVFDTIIRNNVAISEAQAQGMNIYDYDAESNGAKDYQALTNEIIQRYG